MVDVWAAGALRGEGPAARCIGNGNGWAYEQDDVALPGVHGPGGVGASQWPGAGGGGCGGDDHRRGGGRSLRDVWAGADAGAAGAVAGWESGAPPGATVGLAEREFDEPSIGFELLF